MTSTWGRRLLVHSPQREVFLPESSPVTVGRGAEAHVRFQDPGISRRHARLVWDEGWFLEDAGSANGVWDAGRRIDRLAIEGEVEVRLGDPDEGQLLKLEVTGEGPSPTRTREPSHLTAPSTSLERGGIRQVIGRDPTSWLHLDDHLVSWQHAVVTQQGDGWWIEDLGSTNHTIVNGAPVQRAPLSAGDRLLVGGTTLYFDGAGLAPMEAEGFVVRRASLALPGGRRIVDDVSFEITTPSLVAVIGPSGAGKSSLLRLVTGQVQPTSGAVSMDGASMTSQRAANRGAIGVVPQHTVAHAGLTARQALDYTARLRLAADVKRAERHVLVTTIAAQLGLEGHLDTQMARLSGGQQRRVGIAMELLTDPGMLILDEPTAGLDPSLVLQIMNLLRGLASDGKRILVVTHDLEHLHLVDRVIVLRAGGALAFNGRPTEVFAHFGTRNWAETFSLLAEPISPTSSAAAVTSDATIPSELPAQSGRLRNVWNCLRVVFARQTRLVLIDPFYLCLLVGMPVALGVLALAVPGHDGLARSHDPRSSEAVKLLVLLIVGAAFLGLSTSIRDLVGERQIFHHERDAGLSPGGYLLAKIAVFSTIAAIQATVLVAILLLVRDPPDDAVALGAPGLEVAVAAVLTALTGVGLGLAVSSRARTTEQTMPPLVLLVMAQLVMCGGLFPIDDRGLMAGLSGVLPTRWGYAAAASTVDLNHVSPAIDPDHLWQHSPGHWFACVGVLVLMALLTFGIAATGVFRRPRFPS